MRIRIRFAFDKLINTWTCDPRLLIDEIVFVGPKHLLAAVSRPPWRVSGAVHVSVFLLVVVLTLEKCARRIVLSDADDLFCVECL